MRVIAGEFKRRQLKSVPDADGGLRPTSDRVRENVFNLLGIQVEGAAFLDLYSGTGAVGIEALSRGAGRATLVEKHPGAVRVIRENVAMLGLEDRCDIVPRDALQWLAAAARSGRTFDIVFLDPPYLSALQQQTLEILGQGALLSEDAVVMLERRFPIEPVKTGVLERIDARKYGKTHIEIWKKKESMSASG